MEEIKVNKQKKKSSKSKLALSAVAILLTCIFLFGASFILSLSYIINPSPIVFGGGGEKARLEEENQELKAEIEVLESQVERLEASVESYKNSLNSLPEETSEEDTTEEVQKNDQPGTSLHSQKTEETKKEPAKSETNKFDAETTVTPENSAELSEPASEDITVVEIE